jgi:hypothetical protein
MYACESESRVMLNCADELISGVSPVDAADYASSASPG